MCHHRNFYCYSELPCGKQMTVKDSERQLLESTIYQVLEVITFILDGELDGIV